jgi:Nitroreductase family
MLQSKEEEEETAKRKPTYQIDPLFHNRWSPRSMTGEELDDEDIMTLFEAARWAPSSFNNQPWRFIYAKRNSLVIFYRNIKKPANGICQFIMTAPSVSLLCLASFSYTDHLIYFQMK